VLGALAGVSLLAAHRHGLLARRPAREYLTNKIFK
jgi:hypothetical protein